MFCFSNNAVNDAMFLGISSNGFWENDILITRYSSKMERLYYSHCSLIIIIIIIIMVI